MLDSLILAQKQNDEHQLHGTIPQTSLLYQTLRPKKKNNPVYFHGSKVTTADPIHLGCTESCTRWSSSRHGAPGRPENRRPAPFLHVTVSERSRLEEFRGTVCRWGSCKDSSCNERNWLRGADNGTAC